MLTPYNLMFIAKHFSSLEHIYLTTETECIGDCLEEIIARNKQLRKVHIRLPIAYHD